MLDEGTLPAKVVDVGRLSSAVSETVWSCAAMLGMLHGLSWGLAMAGRSVAMAGMLQGRADMAEMLRGRSGMAEML